MVLLSFAALGGVTVPAAAGPTTGVPFVEVFEDVNPCTGDVHTVTIVGTLWVHDHDGRLVINAERTITTTSGFGGRGNTSFVRNGEIEKITLNDILTHDSGDKIRARFVIVTDLSTSTARIITGALTCVGG